MEEEPIVVVDARGMLCPMPIVLTHKAMRDLAPGQAVKVLATDRGAAKDLPAWASDVGNEVLASGSENGTLYFVSRKGEE